MDFEKLIKEREIELIERQKFLESEKTRLFKELSDFCEESKQIFANKQVSLTGVDRENWSAEYDFDLDERMLTNEQIWSPFSPIEVEELDIIIILHGELLGLYPVVNYWINWRTILGSILVVAVFLMMYPKYAHKIYQRYLEYRRIKRTTREHDFPELQ